MTIDHNIANYIVYSEDSILEALKAISKNPERIVFLVTEQGILDGVLTNGDFRRWISSEPDFDASQSVSRISNKNFIWAYFDDTPERIQDSMADHMCLPLLDKAHHLVAFARRNDAAPGLRISSRMISGNSPTFIIAEIGLNHNGDPELAKRLIDLAAEAGADCAKFQMRHIASLYRRNSDIGIAAEDLGTQYTLGLLERFELTPDQMFELFDHCKKRKLIPLCTPWDLPSLEHLERYGLPGYKVASADLTNHDLLTALAQTGKPLIVSTGMSEENEIIAAVRLLKSLSAPFALLHCNSTYPAPYKDINLNYMNRLVEISRVPVGYSGHERGYHVSLAAVAKGALIIEKHFTIDKEMEGNDHKVSLLPEEFSGMVQAIRQIETSLGSASQRRMSQGEIMNRSTLAKSLIATRDLPVNTQITEEMIEVKSPGRGLQPNRRKELLGRTIHRAIKAGDFFYPSDLVDGGLEDRAFHFRRKWGVPVRYHDFEGIAAKSNPDFLEFHFSYRDLDEDISRHLKEPLDFDYIVHSPDLFAGDHLLNLASPDPAYRRRSIEELQRVVNVTRQLRPFFKRASARIPIVASLGGFSKDAPLPRELRPELYACVAESLREIDLEGVEILPQTLPPFPWYFGGQLNCNLFVHAADTVAFCKKHGYRLCFDLCHSKLTCNHFNMPFLEFCESVGPSTGHLHIADAQGVDAEGLQIGEGDMDFAAIMAVLDKHCPLASFIPEIWQGHKNHGEGFWLALHRLEALQK
jgi:N-acetylneuraminate synthase